MMESSGVPLRQWVLERFENYDARIKSNHDSLSGVRTKQGEQGEALVGIKGQLKEQGDDIKEMKEDMKWIKRGLFGAIAVGLMFTIAVASLVVQVAH